MRVHQSAWVLAHHAGRQLAAYVMAGLCAAVVAFADPAAQPQHPPLDLLQRELQHDMPTMWRVTDLRIQDAFERKEGGHARWKARFRATIETSEPTWVPTDLGVGAITVVRPAYPAGVARQLSGRVEAAPGDAGWALHFDLDNRPTMTAGFPLRYFTGRVVEEGSEEHARLVERLHTAQMQAAADRHQAALAALRITHDAELDALRASLESTDRLAATRADIEQRIDTLREAIRLMQQSLDRLATSAAAQGLEFSQWAARGFDSSVRTRRDSSATELVGAPDAGECETRRRIERAWFMGAHEEGEQQVSVSFLEAVIPTEVVVYEMASTGFITGMILGAADGTQQARLAVADRPQGCAAQASFAVAGVTFPVQHVTLMIDGDREGNKAIDAVMLRGVKPGE